MVRYQETPMYLDGETSVDYQPLHVTDTSDDHSALPQWL